MANHLIRQETINATEIVAGSILAFCLFGIIGTFTDKIGSEIGDS